MYMLDVNATPTMPAITVKKSSVVRVDVLSFSGQVGVGGARAGDVDVTAGVEVAAGELVAEGVAVVDGVADVCADRTWFRMVVAWRQMSTVCAFSSAFSAATIMPSCAAMKRPSEK